MATPRSGSAKHERSLSIGSRSGSGTGLEQRESRIPLPGGASRSTSLSRALSSRQGLTSSPAESFNSRNSDAAPSAEPANLGSRPSARVNPAERSFEPRLSELGTSNGVSSEMPNGSRGFHALARPSPVSIPSGFEARPSFETRLGDAAGTDEDARPPNTDNILVTVRLRPLSDRERNRGDREVWSVADHHTIGIQEKDVGMKVKFAFDNVFGNTSTNKQVYNSAAKGVVSAAMDGLNATVFAYGVTSSGKTYTMMGSPEDPGLVQRTINDIFKIIEQSPERDFLLRFSMMEIYNEVLNDLLDPARGNLKLREDPRQGFFVENIKEETLVSAEHALSVIAAGDAHRKVSATTFNEGSSRSHTIMRLSIESSERPGPDADPRIHVARTLSFLNLIDLAGSESARATLTKSHTREGSFINKSLLTLGTVIAKLSDGHAAHIPFRDSKLTRLLQSSMTGKGARIAVVATITPASSQAEETHNTLKFATRAKKVEIHAERNEILDQSSLIMRYQAEITALRRQLEEAARGRGALMVDPLHPEVRNLRERLEEEHMALLQREQDKAALEVRIARLTRIILHSTRIPRPSPSLERYRELLLRVAIDEEAALQLVAPSPDGTPAQAIRKPHIGSSPGIQTPPSSSPGRARGSENGDSAMTPAQTPRNRESPAGRPGDPLTPLRSPLDVAPWDKTPDVAGTVASIRSAGDLFPGAGLLSQRLTQDDNEGEAEAEMLREQVRVMAEEIDWRETMLEALRTGEQPPADGPNDASSTNHDDEDHAIEMQIMNAEREFMEAKLKRSTAHQRALAGQVATLRKQLAAAGMQPEVGAHPLRRLDGTGESSSGDSDDEALGDGTTEDDLYRTPFPGDTPERSDPSSTSTPQRSPDGNRTTKVAAGGAPSQEAAGQLEKLSAAAVAAEARQEELSRRLEDANTELLRQEAQTNLERTKAQRAAEREQQKEAQVKALTKENQQLGSELSRLEGLNNNLQGYGLDNLSNKELSDLINGLTQAVERVRVTVQLRRLSAPSTPPAPAPMPIAARPRPPPAPQAQRAPIGPMQVEPMQAGPYAPMSVSLESLKRAVDRLETKH